MRRRTKIVCTLGPAVESRDAIKHLIQAGMNVARLNCSHGSWEQKARWIEWVRELSPKEGPVAILADLQGPKFRIGQMPEAGLMLRAGETIEVGEDCAVPISQREILSAMAKGDRLLLGDGEIEFKVTGGEFPRFTCRVVTGGNLKSRKGVTLMGKHFAVAALTEKDREDVIAALQHDIDFIALSYVKDADDITLLKTLIPADRQIGICAKIETKEAIHNLAEIIAEVDVIMVARGDMGLQMDLEDVPLTQKKIIEQCNRRAIPVITATQMLESMIQNPRPTRAETTDVFNAILDGTDAVMLSGETAAGAYPTECVKTMARICEAGDEEFDNYKIEREFRHKKQKPTSSDAIAHAAADMSRLIDPEAILCTSTSGQTPRLVSKYRPPVAIYCATSRPRTAHRMAVVWGVEAICTTLSTITEESVDNSIKAFVSARRLKAKDRIIITAGVPVGVPGNTNLIQILDVE